VAAETYSVWSARHTTPQAVEAALRSMLAERFRERHCSVPARYLNLVCCVEAGREGAVLRRLGGTARNSVSRTIVLSIAPDRPVIDALAEVTCDVHPDAGQFGFLRETVILEIGDQHLPDIEAVVDPLLIPDLPTVLWPSHRRPDALELLQPVADVTLLDSMDQPDARAALRWALRVRSHIDVVDLAWVRSSPWRRQAAAAFDPPPLRAELLAIKSVSVVHHPVSEAAALLLAGWLGARLGWSLGPLGHRPRGLAGVADAPRGTVRIELHTDRRRPVSGLTLALETESGRLVSFKRETGGLQVCDRNGNGREQCWTSLGAWPDEDDVLDDGMHRALLMDPLYGEALAAASVLVG
jgi:glucose-6-phosphate dehydrogenase assembly protein OpcA